MAANTDAFKTFTAGVLSKLTDPELKRKAEEALNTLTALDPVAQAFGDGVLAQSELSRKLDALRVQQQQLDEQRTQLDTRDTALTTYQEQLTEWYTSAKDAVTYAREHGFGKPGGGGGKPGEKPATPPAADVVTKEALQQIVVGERAGFLAFQQEANDIQREHFSKFNEIVSINELMQHPKVAELGLKGVYSLLNKDRLEQYDTKKATEAEERIRADERQKVLAATATMPYPSPGGGIGSGSPLDALTVNKPEPLVDQATAHYNRLQQERAAGTRA